MVLAMDTGKNALCVQRNPARLGRSSRHSDN